MNCPHYSMGNRMRNGVHHVCICVSRVHLYAVFTCMRRAHSEFGVASACRFSVGVGRFGFLSEQQQAAQQHNRREHTTSIALIKPFITSFIAWPLLHPAPWPLATRLIDTPGRQPSNLEECWRLPLLLTSLVQQEAIHCCQKTNLCICAFSNPFKLNQASLPFVFIGVCKSSAVHSVPL